MDTGLLLIVITIFALGIGSQILADKYKIPSIIFLLSAGIIAGPEFLDIVNPDAFGAGLQLIVGLSVAVIVFEGAFHLKIDKLKAAQSEAVKLGTIGALISCVLTAVAAYYLLDMSWSVSFLIGALLIATGPTVIKPILDVVPVRKRVEAALETEGIVNDVTAAILALVVYEFVVLETQPFGDIVTQFITRWGSGVFIGIMAAAAAWYLLTQVDIEKPKEAQDARIIVLGAALISYGVAELIITEAGIAAVATAGIILGNLEIPHKREIKEFEDAITVVILSFVFITLTALLSFDDLIALGVGGLLFVLAVTLLIRPISVYASTQGNRFTSKEKAYMSFVGPRGVIPASVATLFALELQNLGQTEAAATIVGSVFLVIFTTSFIEGGLAKHLAERLNIIPKHILIIGAGDTGLSLAKKLEEKEEENVILIDSDPDAIQKAKKEGFRAYQGDARNIKTLQKAKPDNAKLIVTVTHDDETNLKAAKIAKTEFNVDNIIARVNQPENQEEYTDLEVYHVSSQKTIKETVKDTADHPDLWNYLTTEENIQVKEIEVTSNEIIGKEVKEIKKLLPKGTILTRINRRNNKYVPEEIKQIQRGDKITVIGRKDHIKQARETFQK